MPKFIVIFVPANCTELCQPPGLGFNFEFKYNVPKC